MKVLCAIDGSAGSDSVVDLLGDLLSPDRDSVVFYYSPPKVSVHGSSVPSQEVLGLAEEAVADKVVDRARKFLPDRIAASATAVIGSQKPRLGIPAAAKLHRPGMIGVGARGASRFGLPRLGSVSRAVVHAADVPVLVARPRQRATTEPLHLLHCCDQTAASASSASFLSKLTFPEGSVGRVVHVTESPFRHGIPEWLAAEAHAAEADPLAREFIESQEAETERWRQRLAEHCGDLPAAFHFSEPVVLEGYPGERIAMYAESQKVDLIVVGAHAATALGRLLTGSTSDYLLSHASCSVLVIPQHDSP